MNYVLLNLLIFCLESLGVNEENINAIQVNHEKDIFVIFRETVIKMHQVFGENNIFKVME